MFRGQFQHSIDSKGRVSFPARFREVLEERGDTRLVITPALFDPCLHVYPLKEWEAFETKISELPSMDRNIVRFRRLYISPALDADLDKAGRIRVGAEFRTKAELDKDALWAGMGRILELWSKPRFESELLMTEEETEDFQASVQELIRV